MKNLCLTIPGKAVTIGSRIGLADTSLTRLFGLLGSFETTRVNVRKSNHFNAGNAHRLTVDFGAAVAGANQSHADGLLFIIHTFRV